MAQEHPIDTIFWNAEKIIFTCFSLCCMEIFRKWRRWIGLKWNDDIQDKENEMQRLFREGKDFLCNTIQHFLVSANIANEWLLFIPLISYWAICCWRVISIKTSSVYMSCKGKFYVEIQWNSVRKSFRGHLKMLSVWVLCIFYLIILWSQAVVNVWRFGPKIF